MVRKQQVVSRAVQSVVEPLEQRMFLSATLSLVNNEGLPDNNRLVFNYIQNKNTSTPNVQRDQEVLTLKNTGTTTLTINSITLSGPFAIVGTAPAAGTSIAAGGSLPITIDFTQRSLPAHSVNETNESNNTNGGAAITGSLTITSNDSVNPTQSIVLAGYWQNESEDNAEPGLTTIVNTLYGYSTALTYSGQVPNYSNGQVDNDLPNDLTASPQTPVYYGQEVYSPTWQQANSKLGVTLTEVATFHTQGNNVQVGYVTGSESSPTTHQLFQENGVEGQTLLPSSTYSGSTVTGSPYSEPINTNYGAFSLRVDNEYSDNAINVMDDNTGGGGHHFRFYPLIDSSGNVVANTYLVGMDYAIAQTENSDFNDNVFILTNVMPSSTAVPAAPTNLTATSSTDPALSWIASTSSNVAGYNVYRSTSATGTFTKLNSALITTTSYTDTASPPAGVTLYYRVTTVSTAAAPNESTPATVSTNTPTGPVAGSFTVTAYEGSSVDINILAHTSDSSGATILPSSVTIFNRPSGDSDTVNTTTGVVTYTVAAGASGTETFNYTVGDGSQTSTPGTVTLDIVQPSISSPDINGVVAETLGSGGTAGVDTINVLASDVPATAFNTGTLAVGTAAHGKATVGTGESAGEILYQPDSGFIGSDSFSYSVADNNGKSGSATVTVYVGAEISTASTNKVITYTDTDGTNVVAKLKTGTADLYFAGSGTFPGSNNRGVLILGGKIGLADVNLSGTTAASVFGLAGARRGAITLGGITDSSAIGVVSAPTANLSATIGSGTVGLYGGFRSMTLGTVANSSINIGPVGNNAITGAAVENDSLAIAGAVTSSSLNDTVIPLNVLKAASWTNTTTDVLGSISAPGIRTLDIAGQFDPSLSLTGSIAPYDLNSAVIKGAVTTGYWNIVGNVNGVSVGSVTPGWGGLTANGSLRTFVVRAGGFSSALAVGGTLTTFSDNGGLTGSITAGNAGTVHVIGAVTGANLDFTGGGTSLKTFSTNGAVTGTSVQTAGNLNTFVAASLADSELQIGTTGSPTVASATLATLGASTLNTLSLTSRSGLAFSDSQVLASAIRSASLNSVDNTTTGGVAVTSVLHSITERESGTIVRITPTSSTHVFGDFQIRLVTA